MGVLSDDENDSATSVSPFLDGDVPCTLEVISHGAGSPMMVGDAGLICERLDSVSINLIR